MLPASSASLAGQLRALRSLGRVRSLLARGGSFLALLACGLNLVQGVEASPCMRFCSAFLRIAAESSTFSRISPVRARLWPMGAPYPEAELAEGPTMSSRRRQQRWATTRLQRRAVNMMVAVYSFLALGSPATAATADTARCRLTGLQWEAYVT